MRPIAILILLVFAGQVPDVFSETTISQIPEGKRVRIYTQDTGKRIVGRFHHAKKDTLILQKPKGILGKMRPFSIAVTDISKLEVHKYYKSYAKQGALIGAVTGLTLAIIAIASEEPDEPGEGIGLEGLGYFIVPPLYTLGGSLFGAFIGSVSSRDVWQEIDLSSSTAKREHRLSLQLSFRF